MFISFEGIDGCGKTTQLELLRAHLETLGHGVVITREPGGTALAETIRAYLLQSSAPLDARAELLLFGAARAQHAAEVIGPALQRGEIVLCDRFIDSSLAYQGGGLGLESSFIARMNEFATAGLRPDLTILLDVPPAVGQQRRLEQRGADRIEGRGPAFQERVRAAFLDLARAEAQRIVVIDAAPPAKIVHKRIWKEVEKRGLGKTIITT